MLKSGSLHAYLWRLRTQKLMTNASVAFDCIVRVSNLVVQPNGQWYYRVSRQCHLAVADGMN